MIKNSSRCPVCHDQGVPGQNIVRGYRYNSCYSCGMLYLDSEVVASAIESILYDENYFKDSLKESLSGYMDYGQQSLPLRMNFRRLLSVILPHLGPSTASTSRSVLDIGCAYGFFLDEVRKEGFSVHGIDISETAIQWMEEHLGISGTIGLSSEAPNGPFDMISAIEVIEHVKNPHSFIHDVSERLKDNGLLIISTGAHDTPLARLLGRRWWYLNPPDHCSIFSKLSMKKLLTHNNFEILEQRIVAFNWVGLNNLLLKIARVVESRTLGVIAGKIPALVLPVPHFTTQLVIARKNNTL